MASPFCTACGATVADGTRFCVKCGQPVGEAAPPPGAQTTIYNPPSPPPAAVTPPAWTPPPPPPPPVAQPYIQPAAPAQPMPVKEGPGAGLWIGIFGIVLLLGGAGLWFYTMRVSGARAGGSTVQVATTTPESPAAQPTPQPASPQPTPPPDPSQPTPTPTPTSTFVPAPTPNPTTEVIPPNPDQAQKDATPTGAPRKPQPPSRPAAGSPPPPTQPARAARQTSGSLHASVEVAQNGEVVFENLPAARLKFTFDHSLWRPTISHQANGTQTLVMRSLKPGIQRTCDVQWEIVE